MATIARYIYYNFWINGPNCDSIYTDLPSNTGKNNIFYYFYCCFDCVLSLGIIFAASNLWYL